MQNDCEIYLDPEEDEVFFGCVSEREKTLSAKLVNCAGSNPERKVSDVLHDDNLVNVKDEEVEIVSVNERSSGTPEEINTTIDLTESHSELKNSSQKDSPKILSNNTSVELEHNYSTPMKHKIDKSILTTPKSVVKADRDGGFLKVLSEIALVKAEAEGDKKSGDKEGQDEDKENKLISPIPEIKVTEATPEKGSVFSPPKSINTELRRFRIIYNSPQNEENAVESAKGKSHIDNFENEKNFINKCLDQDAEVLGKDKKKSIELIKFNECVSSGGLNEGVMVEKKEEVRTQTGGSEKNEKSVEGFPEKQDSFKPAKPLTPFVPKKPANLRFSKEARKIVEVLKKTAADDTLDFTIPEIDVEDEENSFVSPEPLSGLDDTVIPNKPLQLQPEKFSPKVLIKPADNNVTMKSRTVEKDKVKLTPIISQSRLQPVKYFSERRIYNQNRTEVKKCVKKLPLEEQRPIKEGKVTGGAVATSRIPVFGTKSSKIAVPTSRTPMAKTTPSNTPSGKSYRNPKFNHIESPINAYIHNKPTSLVLNVKPEVKKDCLPSKVWKSQTPGSEKKIQEKPSNLRNPNSAVKLPFVEYKTTTSYKIEKRPESRLPRLAPNVMKLIGSHSPKVLRHEGRFYMNTPRKQTSTENTTIIADPNEVSVVVSQPVQKSNTIK